MGFCVWWNPDADEAGVQKVTCMRAFALLGGPEDVDGWTRLSKSPGKLGGLVYAEPGSKERRKAARGGGGPMLSAAEIAKRKAREEARTAAFRASAIRQALGVWNKAKFDPLAPRIVQYLLARKIDVAHLPGGQLPGTVRFAESLGRRVVNEDGTLAVDARGEGVFERLPGLVCAAFDVSGGVVAVQRIYLDAAKNAKAPGPAPAKKALGKFEGAAVRLSRQDRDGGTLIITEGVETGLAVLAAMERARAAGDLKSTPSVWSVVSCVNMLRVALPADFVGGEGGAGTGGWLKRVIFAGDHDELKGKGPNRARAGALHACLGAEWLKGRYPWLEVGVALPGCTQSPLVRPGPTSDPDPFGEMVDGCDGVDWNDVYAAPGGEREGGGVKGVVCGILGGGGSRERGGLVLVDAARSVAHAPGPEDTRASVEPWGEGGDGGDGHGGGMDAAGHDGDAGEGEILPNDPLLIARAFLRSVCRVDDASGRYGLARWNGVWFRYVASAGRYQEITDERMMAEVWHWLQQQRKSLPRAEGPPVVQAFRPTDRGVAGVLKSMAVDTWVETMTMPVWLPPVVKDGRPAWGAAIANDLMVRAYEPADMPKASDMICYRNGFLVVSELVKRGVVRMLPPTPDVFQAGTRNYDLDVASLEALLAGGEAAADVEDDVYSRVCPWWWKLMRECDERQPREGDKPSFSDVLRAMFGETLGSWRALEYIYAVFGLKNSGKGTIIEGLHAMMGEHAVAPLTLSDFDDEFGMARVVGKAAAVMEDANLGRHTDAGKVIERLKVFSGRGRLPCADKYQSAKLSFKPSARMWIFGNDVPDLRDPSTAMSRRLRFLHMNWSFEGVQDPSVKEGVAGEGAGISLWALIGLVRLLRMPRPQIVMNARGQEVADEFERSSSLERQFVEECCTLSGDYLEAWTDEFHASYARWCDDRGQKAVSEQKLGTRLRSFLGTLDITEPKVRERDGKRQRKYVGVRLLVEAPVARATYERDGFDYPT